MYEARIRSHGAFTMNASASALVWSKCSAVDFADLNAGFEVGARMTGILRELRSVFQQAVGQDDEQDFEGETALSRILDTPGQKLIQRGVMVWWSTSLEDQEPPRDEPPTGMASTEISGCGTTKDERKTRNALPKVEIVGGWESVLK
ncbi:hypothetical protein C8R44DRAFT_729719 [Mycena epipterygia]|nr:hypothetical protein C8R44DRAFT_729719 [Mycena epipterygia]